MGSVRGGVILALLPVAARAEVCDKHRPGWDGTPMTVWSEAMYLASSPVSLLLLMATMLVWRFRQQWGGLLVVALWSIWVSLIAFFDFTGGVLLAAVAEGCVGSSAVFIAAVAAISVATILYTAPRPAKD